MKQNDARLKRVQNYLNLSF